MFHQVCPTEHRNPYGNRPYFRTDEPTTSIGTDSPGVFRTDYRQTASNRQIVCSGGAGEKKPASFARGFVIRAQNGRCLRTDRTKIAIGAQIRRFCARTTDGFTKEGIEKYYFARIIVNLHKSDNEIEGMEELRQLSKDQVIMGFVASCIEDVANRLGEDYFEIYKRMNKVGMIDQYLIPFYNTLHTESRENLTDSLIESLERWEAQR